MKLPVKILLINMGIAGFFGLAFAFSTSEEPLPSYKNFSVMFGLVNIFGGAVDLVIGLFLLFAKDKRYAHGFLLSAGLMILLGLALCFRLRYQ